MGEQNINAVFEIGCEIIDFPSCLCWPAWAGTCVRSIVTPGCCVEDGDVHWCCCLLDFDALAGPVAALGFAGMVSGLAS